MSRAGKAVVAAAGAAAAALIGYRIYLAMLPDEARIRRVVKGIEEAFNEGSVSGITGSLAQDFREKDSNLGRDEVRLVLAQLFLASQSRSAARYRVEVEPGGVDVELEAERPDSARITVTARFSSLSKSGEEREEAVAEFRGER